MKGKTLRRLFLLIVLTIVVLALARVVWIKAVKYQFLARNFGVVEQGAIYRSGQQHPRVLRRLCEELKLKTIVDLGNENPEENAIAESLGITRYEFSLPGDGRGDVNKWAAALKIMTDPDAQPVLVHCATGAQRTTTAAILYRTIVQGIPIQEAYPESFNYKHKRSDWELLAFLADHADEIEAVYRTSVSAGEGGAAESVDAIIERHRTAAGEKTNREVERNSSSD